MVLKMKKLVAIVLVMLLVLTLLTACGKNNGNSGGNTSAPPAPDSNESVQMPDQAAEETNGRMNPPAWLIGEWVTADGANPQSEDVKVKRKMSWFLPVSLIFHGKLRIPVLMLMK